MAKMKLPGQLISVRYYENTVLSPMHAFNPSSNPETDDGMIVEIDLGVMPFDLELLVLVAEFWRCWED